MARTCLAVILAAGDSTRMKSSMSKVLHPIAGLPMISHVMRAVRDAEIQDAVLVLGRDADAVAKAGAVEGMAVSTVLQTERKGTGHAVLMARDAIDFPALLKSLRISPKLLTEPDAMLRVSQVDRLIQKVYEKTRRSDLAFDVGKMLTASAHSFVGFGMLNSDNLDQALRFEAQYFRLIMPSFRMQYRSGADHGEMLFTPAVAMSHLCLAFHLEAIGIAALRELSDLTGDHRPPCRLDLSITEPAHAQRYARELRAAGNVLPDQVQFMLQVGFDSFEIGDRFSADVWLKASHRMSLAYQRGLYRPGGQQEVWSERHREAEPWLEQPHAG